MGMSAILERRALSAGRSLWQSRATVASAHVVKRALILLLPLGMAGPAFAVSGGDIGTLPIGYYVCELPGDATGPAGRHVPEADFSVVNASSYKAGGVRGSYLLTGDRMVMTGGPRKGERYHRISDNFLRRIGPDGQDSEMRCVRRNRNNR